MLDAFKDANNGLKHGIELETVTKSTGGNDLSDTFSAWDSGSKNYMESKVGYEKQTSAGNVSTASWW